MRWSFATIMLVPRDGFVPPQSRAQRAEMLSWAREAGFFGIEISPRWCDVLAGSDTSVGELAADVAHAGLVVSGLNINRCLFTRGPEAPRELARIERAIDVAAALRADLVNVSLSLPLAASGTRPLLRSADATPAEYTRVAEGVARLSGHARAAGVTLVLELHDDGLFDTPETCLALLHRVGAGAIRLNPDLGNIIRGPSPRGDWRRALALFIPHLGNWHVKNYREGRPAPIDEGEIDFAEAWRMVATSGYRGWVSIESRLGDVLAEQRRALAFFHSLAAVV